MADLLLDRKTRRKIADLLHRKKRPREINLETWHRLLHAKLSSITFNDLRVLKEYFPNIMGVIQF